MLIIDEVSDIHNRINQLVDHFCKGNKAAFGRGADIQSGVLAGIIGGRKNKPSFDVLQKLLTAYPSVNPTWLLFGRGSMIQMENIDLIPSSLAAMLPSGSIDSVVKGIITSQIPRSQVDNYLSSMRDKQVIKILEEELLLNSIMDVVARERKRIADIPNRTDEEEARLLEMKEDYEDLNTKYSRGLHTRLGLQNFQNIYKQEAGSVLYKSHGEAEASKPFGGLLTYRLGISEAAAQLLITSGKIRAVNIEGEGYRISEQAVREFLGEA